MTVSVYLPAVLSVLVAVVGRQVATRLAPTPGTVIALVASAVLCAAGTTWALVLLALTLLGFTPLAEEAALAGLTQASRRAPDQRPGHLRQLWANGTLRARELADNSCSGTERATPSSRQAVVTWGAPARAGSNSYTL